MRALRKRFRNKEQTSRPNFSSRNRNRNHAAAVGVGLTTNSRAQKVTTRRGPSLSCLLIAMMCWVVNLVHKLR
jgi:hypothetical protein